MTRDSRYDILFEPVRIGPVTARAAKVAGFPVKVESGAATMEGWVISIVKACGK